MAKVKTSTPQAKSSWIRALDTAGKVLFRVWPRFSQTDLTNGRVLFVCLTEVSDVIQTFPALQAFKKQFPSTQVDYLVGQWAVALVENHPAINDIIVYNAPWVTNRIITPELPSSHGTLSLAWDLRRSQYKAMVSFRPDIRVNIISVLISCPVRAGYKTRGGSFLLTDEFDYHQDIPKYQRHLDMINVFGFQPVYSPPVIIPRETDIDSTQSMLLGIQPQQNTAVIFPGGTWQNLSWPVERFRQVVTQLCTKNVLVILLGGPGRTQMLNEITSGLKFKNLLLWNFPSYGEMAALARHTDIFISSNSCPAHIMSAMNVPCIVLMGSPSQHQTEPLGQYLKLLYPPRACSACQEADGAVAEECSCMKTISVEMVMSAFQNLVSTGVVKPRQT